MLETPSSTTMPRWISRAILGCLLLGVGYACTSIALATTRGPVLPQPMNMIVSIALATVLVGLGAYRFTLLILHRIDRLEAQLEVGETHVISRLNVLANGMIEHGIQLETITGEIPRVRPLVTACPHGGLDRYEQGYADGLARRPMAADATVIPITGRN
jgi:hypothetical protein